MVRTSTKRQKKNEGCCRGWIAKWMGRRKDSLRDEDVAREDSWLNDLEVESGIQEMHRRDGNYRQHGRNADQYSR
jgi:hypothetical protein